MFTADMTTDIGKVRLLLGDLDSAHPIFPDDTQIQVFLDLETSVKSAAALGFETIAGTQALLLKSMQLLDLKTDGLSTARSFLSIAETMRNNDDSDFSGFDIAEQIDNSLFARREYLRKQIVARDWGF